MISLSFRLTRDARLTIRMEGTLLARRMLDGRGRLMVPRKHGDHDGLPMDMGRSFWFLRPQASHVALAPPCNCKR